MISILSEADVLNLLNFQDGPLSNDTFEQFELDNGTKIKVRAKLYLQTNGSYGAASTAVMVKVKGTNVKKPQRVLWSSIGHPAYATASVWENKSKFKVGDTTYDIDLIKDLLGQWEKCQSDYDTWVGNLTADQKRQWQLPWPPKYDAKFESDNVYTELLGATACATRAQISTKSCDKDPHLQPTMTDARVGMDKILEGMGGNAQCKKDMDNTFTTGAASAHASIPFCSAGGQASFTNQASQNAESGCGAVMATVKNQLISNTNMLCSMNATSSCSQTTAHNTASISLIAGKNCKQMNTDDNNADRAATKALEDYVANEKIPKEFKNNNSPILLAFLEQANNRPCPCGNVTLNKITFTASANATIVMINSTALQASNTFKADFFTQSKSQTEAKIHQQNGYQACDPNTKQVINERIANSSAATQTNLNTMMSQMDTTSDNNGNITITAARCINMDNGVLNAQCTMNVHLEHITQMGAELASTTSNSLISDSTTSNGQDSTNAGVASLAKALGDINAKAIKAGGDQGSTIGRIVSMVVLLIAAIVLGPSLIKKMKR